MQSKGQRHLTPPPAPYVLPAAFDNADSVAYKHIVSTCPSRAR